MNIKEKYEKEVRSALANEFGIKNGMAIPSIQKIVVNMGTGDSFKNKEAFKKLTDDLAQICGQKPKVQKARISVAGFNLRAGMPVGLSCTLRGKRMYDFLERLITIVLPRLRDFRGIPTKGFDKSGNYTLGIVEHTVFPEIDLAKVDHPHGLEVTIVTNARDQERSRRLLILLGMPFSKEEEK